MHALPIIILTGPTAVGKTALSLKLAGRLNAEIISADSRQVYRSIDIGTAKPSKTELAQCTHHFIDELDLGMPFSAGLFADEAYKRIHNIIDRGRTPLVVGGSTLYLHALQYGLADIPHFSADIRARIEARLESEGAERLFELLEGVDPESAATMDATKTQRLIRALEVFQGTGKPLSSFYAEQKKPPFVFRTIVLNRDRDELYDRINHRVDVMIDEGLLAEVQSILDKGYDRTLNPLKTIGYQEPIAFLTGEIEESEMIRLIKRNSRRYAKRQLTWFRRYADYEWIDVDDNLMLERVFLKRSSIWRP